MESSEDISSLEAIPLLREMPDNARRQLIEMLLGTSEIAELEDGSALFHQGDLGGDAGFVLLSGTVRVEREGFPSVTMDAPAILGEIQQFNPRAQRTATVLAKGFVRTLRFSWQALYEKAREVLTHEEQHRLMDAFEKSVCERLSCERLVDVPIFRALPEHLKVSASLALHWLAQREVISDGETLFEQDSLCGGNGFLLFHGGIELRVAGRFCHEFRPPSVLGVMPEYDPETRWTATAVSRGDSEVLKFSWPNYVAMLRQRLESAEVELVLKSVSAANDECFVN